MPIPTSYAQARAEVERLVERFSVVSAHNRLYGLTEEEITIVEGQAHISQTRP
jgi:hypothetical protein